MERHPRRSQVPHQMEPVLRRPHQYCKRVCYVRRKSPIAAVAQDFIPREENQERREHLVYYLIFLPTLEEGHAIGVRGMLNS